MYFKRNAGKCRIEGCPDHAKTRGWCNRHYLRWLRNGDPLKTIYKEKP